MAKKEQNLISQTLTECKKALWVILALTGFTNILMLMLPIYSLQVLDRVLSSASMDTLLMLTLLAVFLFIAFALITAAKSSAMVKIGEWIDSKLSSRLLDLSIASANIRGGSGSQNLRDLSVIRSFTTGQSMLSLLDAPWCLLYIGVIFVIHPVSGFVTLGGGIVLLILAIFNEFATKPPLEEANEVSVKAMSYAEISTRNAEAVEAMGMSGAILKQWNKINDEVVKLQSLASNRSGVIVAISRFMRMFIQVLIIAVGAYLTVINHMSPGGIIACSILASRALAPFETSITLWKSIIDARKSYERLSKNIDNTPLRDKNIELPTPTGKLQVDRVMFGPPSSPTKAILKGVTFELQPGESVAVIGPSAAGKSTLAKLIMGLWKPQNGSIRLDGADVYAWNREQFGENVGYLPQDIELFRGSVKENIARLKEDVSDEEIIKAAQMAGAHEMILRLAKGYETDIGFGGALLSGGQRQRIGLARAFFGNPKLVVLDEPNANLDIEGEASLLKALENAKKDKITTVVITHRNSILGAMDKILVMKEGISETFGPSADVISRYMTQKPNFPQVQGPAAQQSAAVMAGAQKPTEETQNANVTNIKQG